jgi:chromosome segregation ATPase
MCTHDSAQGTYVCSRVCSQLCSLLTSSHVSGTLKAMAESSRAACEEAHRVKTEKEEALALAVEDKHRRKQQLDKANHERDEAMARCNHLLKDLEDQGKLVAAKDAEIDGFKKMLKELKEEIDGLKASLSATTRDLDKVFVRSPCA